MLARLAFHGAAREVPVDVGNLSVICQLGKVAFPESVLVSMSFCKHRSPHDSSPVPIASRAPNSAPASVPSIRRCTASATYRNAMTERSSVICTSPRLASLGENPIIITGHSTTDRSSRSGNRRTVHGDQGGLGLVVSASPDSHTSTTHALGCSQSITKGFQGLVWSILGMPTSPVNHGDHSSRDHPIRDANDRNLYRGYQLDSRVARALSDIGGPPRCLAAPRLEVGAAGPEMAGKASEPF